MSKKSSFTLCGLFYGICLAALGWQASGAGHGTFFFFSLAVFPFGIGFLLWPVIAFLLVSVQDSFYKMLFLIVIAGRYILLAIYVFRYGPEEVPHIIVTWSYSPFYVLAPLILFVAGQVLIWALFVRGVFLNRRDALSAH